LNRSYLYLIVLVMVWGSAFPVIKIALDYLSPFLIALVRVTVGGTLLLLVSRKLIYGKKEAISAVLNVGLFMILLNLGVEYSSNPGLTSTMIYTQPVFVTVLSRFVLRERLIPLQILGVVLAFSGVLISVGSTDFSIGSIIAILGGLTWAVGTIYHRLYLSDRDVAGLNTFMSLFSALLILPLSFVDSKFSLDPVGWGSALLLAVTAQATGFLLWFKSVNMLGPVKASSAVLLVPVSSYLFSALLLRTAPTLLEGLGSSITLLGVFLTFLRPGTLRRSR